MLSGDAAAATASSSLSNECVNKKWKLEKFLLLFFYYRKKVGCSWDYFQNVFYSKKCIKVKNLVRFLTLKFLGNLFLYKRVKEQYR